MKKRGFSLVEIMVVVGIMVILIGIAVPMFSVTRLEAQKARANVDLASIKSASLMLYHDTDAWPPVGNAGTDIMTTSGLTGWSGPYLDEWTADPWGNMYNIYDSGIIRYIESWGPDGAPAGGDDIEIIMTPDTT